MQLLRLNKKNSVIQVTGLKILGRVGTHFFCRNSLDLDQDQHSVGSNCLQKTKVDASMARVTYPCKKL